LFNASIFSLLVTRARYTTLPHPLCDVLKIVLYSCMN
jgi:hypothetical protein